MKSTLLLAITGAAFAAAQGGGFPANFPECAVSISTPFIQAPG